MCVFNILHIVYFPGVIHLREFLKASGLGNQMSIDLNDEVETEDVYRSESRPVTLNFNINAIVLFFFFFMIRLGVIS